MEIAHKMSQHRQTCVPLAQTHVTLLADKCDHCLIVKILCCETSCNPSRFFVCAYVAGQYYASQLCQWIRMLQVQSWLQRSRSHQKSWRFIRPSFWYHADWCQSVWLLAECLSVSCHSTCHASVVCLPQTSLHRNTGGKSCSLLPLSPLWHICSSRTRMQCQINAHMGMALFLKQSRLQHPRRPCFSNRVHLPTTVCRSMRRF